MSKARLIITAVVVGGRAKSEVARDYDLSRSWVHELVQRFRAEGEAAFSPRSRRSPEAFIAIAMLCLGGHRPAPPGRKMTHGCVRKPYGLGYVLAPCLRMESRLATYRGNRSSRPTPFCPPGLSRVHRPRLRQGRRDPASCHRRG
jgi:hypothetical protein